MKHDFTRISNWRFFSPGMESDVKHDFTGPWDVQGLICVNCGIVPQTKEESETECPRECRECHRFAGHKMDCSKRG